MKQDLIDKLHILVHGEDSIKFHVDEIHALRLELDPHLSDLERTDISNDIRGRVQREAQKFWFQNAYRGAVLMATGTGKSKVGVEATADVNGAALMKVNRAAKVLIVVPTEKLRDEGWKEEFEKWDKSHLWDACVRRTCYASLNKIDSEEFDLVILDEGHNITPNNAQFFEQNTVRRILWLSGTKPKDMVKVQLLKTLKINPVYEITLDEAVKLGLVAPYDITVITLPLDTTEKYVKAGRKDQYFFQTEKEAYSYLSRMCIAAPSKRTFLNRMQFIYGLRSKTKVAKWILENLVPKDIRTLIFCGGKKQANELCEHRFYSRPSKPKMPTKLKGTFSTETKEWDLAAVAKLKEYDKYIKGLAEYELQIKDWQGDKSYNDFKEKLISWLSCCEALNEGHNIPDLDCAFIVQLNSSELDLWQRIGRIVRFRPGHVAKIIILAVRETVDVDWVNKATARLDGAKIKWVTIEDIQLGKETLIIN